jgi:hypothetical protein
MRDLNPASGIADVRNRAGVGARQIHQKEKAAPLNDAAREGKSET